MITEIGIVAGEIWQFLDKNNETTVSALTKDIDRPHDEILMSLGWLAREGHIVLQELNGDYLLSLRPKSKFKKA